MTADIHSLLAPYALDALDPDERARFELHVEQCEECRAELAGFLATAGRMSAMVEHPAPDGLRERVLAAAARAPQERPVVTSLATRSRWHRAVPRILVAASMLVALAGFGSFALERDRNGDLRAERAEISSVLTAPDVETENINVPNVGTVRMLGSKEADGAVLLTSDMRPLDDKTYQLWTLEEGKARSRGLMTAESGVYLIRDVGKADTVAITVEPAGGSKQPTTKPVMSTPL